MEKETSVLKFLNSTSGKVISIILGLYIAVSIIPALLNAKSDFAVTIGVIAIIGSVVSVIKFWDKITNWLN